MLSALWLVVTLPFRLVAWAIHLLGRATALVVGFGLMVLGGVLCAGEFAWLGLPLFVFGLVLTLRSLG